MDVAYMIAHARARFGLKHGEGAAALREHDADRAAGARTDLALEAHQLAAQGRAAAQIPGVRSSEEALDFGTLTRLYVESEIGARILEKPIGHYTTIQVPRLQERRREVAADVSRVLAREIEGYLERAGLAPNAPVLVVGLGNWNATPDNVGPLTTSKLLVTRHLHEYRVLDEETLGRMRPVAALSPGVLGLTGVETAEIVRGVVERMKPQYVICVDALAARSVERLGTTFQLADVGIQPGSGIGNTRAGLSRQTLGVPVLALGCPTVIYAATIVAEAIDRLAPAAPQHTPPAAPPAAVGDGGSMLDPSRIVLGPPVPQRAGRPFGQAGLDPGAQPGPQPVLPAAPAAGNGFGSHHAADRSTTRANVPFPASAPGPVPDPAARQRLIEEVLGPSVGSLVVTPKDVDLLVETLSDILADALNEALHPGLTAEEAAQLR